MPNRLALAGAVFIAIAELSGPQRASAPPRNLGAGIKTVMPRRSASARGGRCGECGLTLMAVALFHGSMLRSRAAATSAPAKFGNPAVRRKWKARYALSTSLSQTHCRAALLSAKSRAMTKSAAARPSDSQGRNLLHEKPRESLASQTLHPVDREAHARWAGGAAASIQAALRRRRAGDAWLGRCSKVWMRSNWMRWSIRRGTTRLSDRRPQFAAR
jgi:hypothetical protein